MIDLDELIAEAEEWLKDHRHGYQDYAGGPRNEYPGIDLMKHLVDALEEVEAERDEWRTEHGIVKERSSTRFQAYQQKKRELRAMEIERDAALARIAEAAKLHQPEVIGVHEGHGEEVWCPHCEKHWPCPTAEALGLNEGENDD